MKDNSNLVANIGFICFTPFHYYVYKNIYAYIPNSEFIIGDIYGDLSQEDENDRIRRLGKFLQKKGVYWKYIDHTDRALTVQEYEKYGLLVSCLYKGAIAEDYNTFKKKVRILYGNAKDKWNFGAWNVFFDLILTYGNYSQKYLRPYGTARVVGNPKFDDWFSETIDIRQINNLKKKLDNNKKTLLFIPTYGILSSQKTLYLLLEKLSKEFNVIAKLHHNSLLYEHEEVKKFKNSHIHLKTDEDDVLPLLKCADLVISDNSGGIFDALIADIPLLCIDISIKNEDSGIYYDNSRRFIGVATNKSSLEQKIKKNKFQIGQVLTIDDTFLDQSVNRQYIQIKEIIDKSIQERSRFNFQRENLKKELFIINKESGKNAAKEILHLLYKSPRRRNFLSQSIIDYSNFIIDQHKKNIDVLLQENDQRGIVAFYYRIQSLPIINRVIFIFKEFF